ncbi:MAG: hypothetical protein JSV52_06005 [Candidatus Zixiibacteriota bacterium]|nr:MAG: hypothetical protein JSV52_06005 [candidate division Zixibacteria bacterium]
MPQNKRTIKPIDLTKVRTYSIRGRKNRTRVKAFGRPMAAVDRADFFESLPDFLKASDFNEFIARVAKARKNRRPFHLLLGAHTIKVGLSPVINDLMRRGIVTGVSLNSAGLIHDVELAFWGETSEDVQAGLENGSFGMVKETAEVVAAVGQLASEKSIGLGEAAGSYLHTVKARFRKHSIFATAHELGLPATVHVGIGTDIVSQQPDFNAAQLGEASHVDFRILSSICRDINRGGAVANIGSAVILPEVFLKALTVARNVYGGGGDLTTANFDMIMHYRPRVNVVDRPTFKSGKGFNFVGHHEIMIPLLAWGLRKKFKK